MNIRIGTDLKKIVKKDTVIFNISFSCIKPTSKLAITELSKDMGVCVQALKDKLELTDKELSVGYINIMENKVWRETQVENPQTHAKEIKKVFVKEGYRAFGSVSIELPLTWKDENHKFSTIYIIANNCEYETSTNYHYVLKNYAEHLKDLRGKLVDKSREQAMELLPKTNGCMSLIAKTILYNANNEPPYAPGQVMMKARASAEPEPENDDVDLEIIDNLISVETAPTQEIIDSIEIIWEVI